MARGESTLPPVPNFSFNPGPAVPTGPAEIQLQKQQQEANQNQQNMNNVLRTTQMASELVQSFVDASKKRQQRDALQAYAAFDPNRQVTSASTSMTPGPISQPQTDLTQTTLGQTPEGQAQQRQLLARVMATNPDLAAQGIMRQAFPTNLQGVAAQGVTSGQTTLPAAASALQKPSAVKITQLQKEDGLHQTLVDAKGNKIDLGLGKQPIASTSPLAEVRKAALINNMNQALPKLMNPARWSGNDPAAVSAKTIANAESAKILADQILNKQIPGNSQSIANLNTEVARVLGQTGQVTDSTRKDLETQTGFSKLADAAQFFTNNPTDRRAGAFVSILKQEMSRQQQFRQKTVDATMAGNLQGFDELRQIAPQAWEDGLRANGIDPEAAKQKHFRLLPEYVSQLTGQSPTSSNLEALRASVKNKLGL